LGIFGRYQTSGNWYKGNTHIHSTKSDGGLTFPELAVRYADAGYDFLFRTDHWVASDVMSDGEEYPLLWLDGIELDGSDHTGAGYHVACLGSFSGLSREIGFSDALEMVREQGGIRILAHPYWMGNSFDDALRWKFDGVEVYNNVCWWANGKGDSGPYWQAMLGRFPATTGFAADDAHISEDDNYRWNGGWIMVNASALSREAIVAAIRAGQFYSSRGPAFHSIEVNGNCVRARTSPVKYARLVGPGPFGIPTNGPEQPERTECAFEIPEEWDYAFLEIEDAQGLRAWTNPL
jgi:hypothetical protein